VIVMTL